MSNIYFGKLKPVFTEQVNKWLEDKVYEIEVDNAGPFAYIIFDCHAQAVEFKLLFS